MQRAWRRSWQREKLDFIKFQPIEKESNLKKLTSRIANKILPPVAAAGMLLATMTGAHANPVGGQITTGSGAIAQNGKTMIITQSTDKLGINWQSFNVGTGEKVQYVQPGKSSIALNRVMGNDASAIYGTLSANGKVFLINPNGLLFAPGAQVNVGGLVASTLSLSDSDFIAGKYKFSGKGGSVVNQGNISATDSGYVVMLGSKVKNEGIIVAQKGTVALGAGNAVTLDMNGDGLLSMVVDQGSLQALAENKNLIQADGGQVIMTVRSANALAGTAVNNSGVIQARSIYSSKGIIYLDSGYSGTVTNSGTLDASGKNVGESGGIVKVLGDSVELVEQANLDASGTNGGGTVLVGGNLQGKRPEQNVHNISVSKNSSISADALTQGNGGKVVVWADNRTEFSGNISAKGGASGGDGGNVEVSGKQKLVYQGLSDLRATHGQNGTLLLDPSDYTIAASGGDSTGVAIASQLGLANVTILSGNGASGTNGDININDDINWTGGNSLTLSAYRNVNVNANVHNTDATGASIVLHADNTGTDVGTISIASGKDITTNGQVSIYYNPSGTFNTTVNGSTISVKNYTVPTDYSSYVKSTSGAKGTVTAYMLVNDVNQLQAMGENIITLAGKYALGKDIDASSTDSWNGGMGFAPIGSGINDSVFMGSFDGLGSKIDGLYINRPTTDYVGLFGSTYNANIVNVGITKANITGQSDVGALAGWADKITNSYSSGFVCGGSNIGGLVGVCSNITSQNSSITSSNSSSTVIGSGIHIGGLVGAGSGGVISNSYSTGTVTGGEDVGGLVGYEQLNTIANSYSTGAINGKNYVGGLVGEFQRITISNSHSEGSVCGKNHVGGLVGEAYNNGNINNSYSISIVNGENYVGGLVGSQSIDSNIANSYSTGIVNGIDYVGGLAGGNSTANDSYNTYGSSIINSYSTGSVIGNSNVGGLVGYNSIGGTITNSYSAGNASGRFIYGGLAGSNYGTISNSYSSGTGNGFVPYNSGTITNCYWDNQTAGGSYSFINLGNVTNLNSLTTDQAKSQSSYIGFNFSNTWKIYDGYTYPLLKSFLTPLTVTVNNFTKTYDGQGYTGNAGVTYSITPSDQLKGTLTYLGSRKNVGNYVISANGLYSGQQGYDISYVNGILTINPRLLTVTAIGQDKIYDDTSAASVTYSDNRVSGDILNISVTANFQDKNVGSNKTINVSGINISGDDASNYTLASVNAQTTANINKAPLTIRAQSNTKTYDGTTGALATPMVSGLQGNDTATALTEAYADKNVGTGKTLQITGYTITDGNGGNNYTVNTVNNTNGVIDKAVLTITAASNTKTYDGTASAIAVPTVSGLQGNDIVTSLTEAYADKNAGTGKTLQVAGYTITDENGGNNYTVKTVNNTNGVIDQASLMITAASNTKTYDGTVSAAAVPTVFGLQGNDTVTDLTEGYADKNAGTGKTLQVIGYTITDKNGGNNYIVTTVNNASGVINQANLTVTADNATKYFNAPNPILTTSYSSFQGSDTPAVLTGTLILTTMATQDSQPGTYLIIPSGLSAMNYQITFVNGQLVIVPNNPIQSAALVAAYQNMNDSTANLNDKNGKISSFRGYPWRNGLYGLNSTPFCEIIAGGINLNGVAPSNDSPSSQNSK